MWLSLLQRKIQVLADWWCRYLLLSNAGVCCLVVEGACCLVMQVAPARWCWNRCCRFTASLAGFCQEVQQEDQRWSSEEFLKLALKRAGYNFQKSVLKRAVWESFGDCLETGIGCAESAAVISWIPQRLLAAGYWLRRRSHVSRWLLGEAQLPLLRVIFLCLPPDRNWHKVFL